MSDLLFTKLSLEQQQIVAGGSPNVTINNNIKVNNNVAVAIAVGRNNKISIKQSNKIAGKLRL